MNITNNKNLPEVIVRKINREKHNAPHTVSATTLKSGTRAFWLTDRHDSEITVDVVNMLWALWGTVAHTILEEEDENTFVEEKVEKLIQGDWKVTGRIDGYNMLTCEVYDWKTTSAWKIVYKNFDDWKFQGLVYAWLLKQNGLECKKCRFIAMLKDHSRKDAMFNTSYPQEPVSIYEFDVTEKDLADIEIKIRAKMKEIIENENTPDDELPLCTPEERWQKTEYAVFKNKTSKRAEKVFNEKNFPNTSDEELLRLANEFKDAIGGELVDRSKDGKCDGYCACCEFCTYWQENYNKPVENIE